MLNRTITALLLASFFLAILVFFNHVIVASVLTLITILAFNEWLTITKINSASKKILLFMFVLLMTLLAYFSNYILIKYINIIYLAFWLFVSLDIIFGSHFTKLILQKSPIVVGKEIKAVNILKSTLSADHRVLDGAVAGKLLKDYNDIIENPFQIWLESDDMVII